MSDEIIQTGKLAAALAKAQGAFKPIKKSRDVAFGEGPRARKFRYAEIADIIEGTREALSANGLAITQTFMVHDPNVAVLCTALRHESGEVLETFLPVPLQGGPQEFGKLTTYTRRYLMSAILCVAGEDDDDVQGIEHVQMATQPAQRPVQTPYQRKPYQPTQEDHEDAQEAANGHDRGRPQGSTADSNEENLRKAGLITHKGWLTAHELDTKDRTLSYHFLTWALGCDPGEEVTHWRELTSQQWGLANHYLSSVEPETVMKMVSEFSQKRELATAD